MFASITWNFMNSDFIEEHVSSRCVGNFVTLMLTPLKGLSLVGRLDS